MCVSIHSYCSQVLSKDVDECVSGLLKELVRYQDRLYQKDPMKARMKKRLVMGLREVLKHLRLHKVKCVVISPNCERIQSKGTGSAEDQSERWGRACEVRTICGPYRACGPDPS